jgi:hypothetical protein
MLPVPGFFSMPPMRCIRPGVPGLIHGRAPFSSRLKGSSSPSGPFFSSRNFAGNGVKLAGSGTFHGSAALPI